MMSPTCISRPASNRNGPKTNREMGREVDVIDPYRQVHCMRPILALVWTLACIS